MQGGGGGGAHWRSNEKNTRGHVPCFHPEKLTLDVTSTSVEAIVARALARHNVLLAIDTWVLAIVLNRTSVALQLIA